MKVLIATYWEYPHAGGVSSHMASLRDALVRNGVDAFAVGCNTAGSEIGGTHSYISKIEAKREIQKEELHRLINQQKFDIVNAQDVRTVMALKEIRCTLPVILTVHGYLRDEAVSAGAVSRGSKEDEYLLNSEWKGYRYADDIIAVDTRISEHVLKISGRKAHVLHNFVNVENYFADMHLRMKTRSELSISPEEKVIFCPRRLTAKNGVMVLVKAFKIVSARNRNIRLIIAGDGEERGSIENYIRKHGLNNVVLLGTVKPEEMSHYYSMSDMVCIPSITVAGVQEATSIACLEAMASRVPVIASNIGGLSELITDGFNGYLVKENDVHALAAKIKQVLSTDSRIIVKNAYDYLMENYSGIGAAKKFIRLYNSVAASKMNAIPSENSRGNILFSRYSLQNNWL